MKLLLHWLLCLALAVGGFATTDIDATTAGEGETWMTPIYQNNEKAVVETWVGRTAVNMGWVVGDELFKVAKVIMQEKCPDNSRNRCTDGSAKVIKTSRITTYPHVAEDSWVKMRVYGEWGTNGFREMLIELAAMALQYLTTGHNCYHVEAGTGRGTHCNLGNFVYINMADEFIDNHHRNFIRIRLEGPDNGVYNEFKCCKSLGQIDTVVDSKSAPISKLYHGVKMTRDAKCLIAYRYECPRTTCALPLKVDLYGYMMPDGLLFIESSHRDAHERQCAPETTCGECGPKCDACGAVCKDVCPSYKCNALVSRDLAISNDTIVIETPNNTNTTDIPNDTEITVTPIDELLNTPNDELLITPNDELLNTPNAVPEIAKIDWGTWSDVIQQHNGKALVETWVGRAAVNVGKLTGRKLYDAVKPQIASRCQKEPNRDHWCRTPRLEFRTTRVVGFPNIKDDAVFRVQVRVRYDNDAIRDLLFELAARTMESLTSTAENCYKVRGHDDQCNIGDFIHINLPTLGLSDNWIRMNIDAMERDVYGQFKCCRSLSKIDEVSDRQSLQIQKLWGKKYTRDSKCLITFQYTCGECGKKCDACGASCPKVCPHHDKTCEP